MTIDTQLLEKYSSPGPRYTSYPTAPYFSEAFVASDWQEELSATHDTTRGLSLYVHIPFCDSLCFYCGCNMVATQRYEHATLYLKYLFEEIARLAAFTASGRVVQQIHWGGGTPTFLNPDDIRQLFAQIQSHFFISTDAEIACEIDPRELSHEHVQALLDCGFNRFSLGVQDLDLTVQQAVNRVQPEALVRETFGWMRDAQVDSINMDLMVGLPYQTVAGFSRTLDAIIDMSPDRLAVFSYAHVPWIKKHQKIVQGHALPNLSVRIALQQLILSRLTEAGYMYIGMDHYAKPTDELVTAQRNLTLHRNFQGYTTHKNCDVLALGVSAISQTEHVYVQNAKNLKQYQGMIANGGLATERGIRIQYEDRLRRDAITHLMCNLRLNMDRFSEQWNIDFKSHFSHTISQLQPMIQDGLVYIENATLQVTDTGRFFLRNIAMCFDAYLNSDATIAPRYSKTL